KALQAGKNVLCEKPMATTLAECELMAKTAAITGKKLMIAQNQRLNPAHIKAKELLNSGIIGDVITFKTTFSHSGADNWSIDGNNSWFLDKSKGCFGAMADLGIHKTDLMVYLLGKKIVKCSAVIKTLNKKFNTGEFISVDDNAFCTYIMEGGIVGTMNASWTNYGKEDNCTEIFGTKGAMYIYKDINHSIIVERLGQSEYFDTEAIQTNDNQTATGIIDMFVDCIINDKKPAISAEDVLPAMKAIFACVRSSEQNSELINI
ncbi:MAG: Gfo/Idh/MocA family oxidoreductase, partial [Oscillospiraceae bacterium]